MSSSLAFRPSLNPSNTTASTASTARPIISTIAIPTLPNNLPSYSRAAKKRKHGRHSQDAKGASKRRKATGRPRNDWTRSRLRKLVRLYLMTHLEVGEITKVLRRKDFHPCPRDVQKKLELFLQPRPNQLRQKKHFPASRLRVFEECRRLHRSWRESKSQNSEHIHQSVEKHEMLWAPSGPISVPPNEPTTDWWLLPDHTLNQDYETYCQSIDHMCSIISSSTPEDSSIRTVSISTTLDGDFITGLALSDFGLNQQSTSTKVQQATRDFSTNSNQNIASTEQAVRNFSRPFVQPHVPPLRPVAEPRIANASTLPLDEPCILVEDYDFVKSDPNHICQNTRSIAQCNLPETENRPFEDQADIEIRVSIGGRSSQGSFLSITSLNRRLSSKYSQSDLQNIRSVMRLTVTRSSVLFKSDEKCSSTSSIKSSRVFLRQPESCGDISSWTDLPSVLQQPDSLVILPGIFHTLCAAQIKIGYLQPCRRDGICEHYGANIRRFFINKPSSGKVLKLWRIKRSIDDVDQFGNTVLHAAASLPLPVWYIMKLINQNANTNATNLAGQTFLHLLRAPNEADDVCSLLEILSVRGFNFKQQDQNGQSSLHCLMSPSFPRSYHKKIVKKLLCLNLIISDVRDNRGFTLAGLMNLGCSQLFGFNPYIPPSLEPLSDSNSFVDKPNNQVNHLTGLDILAGTVTDPSFPRCQHEVHNSVQTNEDLQRYYHADLLRTIVKAGERPSFEDHRGRNGIHCLGEVMIDLPHAATASTSLVTLSSSTASSVLSSTPVITKREQYLQGLLAAGVNPNSHDKQGMTPLMAFIIHTRRYRVPGKDEDQEEDDATTTRLLILLLDARADIDRRNRNGETALHLAVKLGRRAATKCLLARGANVHARNSKGQGAVYIGMRACNEVGRNGEGGDDEKLYARIILCLCLAVSVGAVSEPSVLQEWASSTVEWSIIGKEFMGKGRGRKGCHKDKKNTA